MLLTFIGWMGMTVIATSTVLWLLFTVAMPAVLIVGAAQGRRLPEPEPA